MNDDITKTSFGSQTTRHAVFEGNSQSPCGKHQVSGWICCRYMLQVRKLPQWTIVQKRKISEQMSSVELLNQKATRQDISYHGDLTSKNLGVGPDSKCHYFEFIFMGRKIRFAGNIQPRTVSLLRRNGSTLFQNTHISSENTNTKLSLIQYSANVGWILAFAMHLSIYDNDNYRPHANDWRWITFYR